MDKFIQVLEFIEDTPKSWKEISNYCNEIGLDPQHAWDVMMDKRNPLIIEQNVNGEDGIKTHTIVKFRPSLEGHRMVDSHKNGSKKGVNIVIKDVTSSNINAITGNGSKSSQTMGSSPSAIQTLPYTQYESNLISMGRWLMKKLFGSLDHSIKPVAIVVSILSLATSSPLFYEYYISYQQKIMFVFSQFIILDIFAFVLVVLFGWGFVLSAIETKCPKCNNKFAFTRKSRILESRIDLPEKEVRNYKSSYSCDFCKYTKKDVPEIVEIEKSSK